MHAGGAAGTVALFGDGEEVARVPLSALRVHTVPGSNLVLGPNAGHREGRMYVAKFGYRTGSAEVILGPVR